MMNIAVVTGASSGIGREFVRQIDRAYTKLNEIWVIARRKDRLEELQASVRTALKVIPMDLTDQDQIQNLQLLLQENRPTIKMLVNSSGYGVIGNFTDDQMVDAEGMIDLNCKALTLVTHICLPYMANGSRIIQMASSAAFLPQPGFAVYAASKAYVLSFSRALNDELAERGIYVTAVCPGPVKTEFFDIAEKNITMPRYKKSAMANAKDVVKNAMKASSDKKEVAVYGGKMKLFSLASRIIPQQWMIAAAGRMNEKNRKNQKKQIRKEDES